MKLPSLKDLLAKHQNASTATTKPTKSLEELLADAQALIDRSRDLDARVESHLADVGDYQEIRGCIDELQDWVTSHQSN